MKENKKVGLMGWIIIALSVLIEIYAMYEGITTGNYQVNYGLTGVLMFSYVIAVKMFGWKKMILMNIVSAFFAFFFENTSVSFGFPFGFFNHFAEQVRIGNVPLQVGFGYFFYAFAGWLFADLVIGKNKQDKVSIIGRPLIGAFVAASMDLITDGINGLLNGMYEYPMGGGFFGSPLSNSCGWIITTFCILIIWELFIIPKFNNKKIEERQKLIGTPSIYHLQNSILLGLMSLAPLFGFLILENKEVVDVLGNTWQSKYAYEASTMIGLLGLVFAMVIGIFCWIRKREVNK